MDYRIGLVLLGALCGCGDGGGSSGTGAQSTGDGSEDDDAPQSTSTGIASTGSSTTVEPETETGTSTGEDACAQLVDLIDADAIEPHLLAFDQIATENGGSRAAGAPGYEASVQYVRSQLSDAGYEVLEQDFELRVFNVGSPPVLERTIPTEQAFAYEDEYWIMYYSAPGDVTGPTHFVDLSGCNANTFNLIAPGEVALLTTDCHWGQSVALAQQAGAIGVVFVQPEGGAGSGGTLGTEYQSTIPALMASWEVGQALLNASAHIVVDTSQANASTVNVIVQTASGDPNEAIILGAHLDGVPTGPGVNDNATGTAVLLEIAKNVADCELSRKLAFAWWGGEELGLHGSQHFVTVMPPEQREQIALYINVDMIGSPNYVRFLLDGDGSASGVPGPPGSAEIEAALAEWFDVEELPVEEYELDGRGDYQAFMDAGIGVGGLLTGMEGIKTAEQAEIFGGTPGEAYDACYHETCDTIDNVDVEVNVQIGKAIAHAVTVFAY